MRSGRSSVRECSSSTGGVKVSRLVLLSGHVFCNVTLLLFWDKIIIQSWRGGDTLIVCRKIANFNFFFFCLCFVRKCIMLPPLVVVMVVVVKVVVVVAFSSHTRILWEDFLKNQSPPAVFSFSFFPFFELARSSFKISQLRRLWTRILGQVACELVSLIGSHTMPGQQSQPSDDCGPEFSDKLPVSSFPS